MSRTDVLAAALPVRVPPAALAALRLGEQPRALRAAGNWGWDVVAAGQVMFRVAPRYSTWEVDLALPPGQEWAARFRTAGLAVTECMVALGVTAPATHAQLHSDIVAGSL